MNPGLSRPDPRHFLASVSLAFLFAACGGTPTDSDVDATGGAQNGTGGHSTGGGSPGTGGASTGGGFGSGGGGPLGSGGVQNNTGGVQNNTGGVQNNTGGAPNNTGGAGDTGGNTGSGGVWMPQPIDGHDLEFVGNITTWDQVDTNDMVFSDYWDKITPENAGKWGSVQQSPGGNFNWNTLDAIYDYTESKGIIFKQHAFVWGSQQPGGTPTADQVENWIQAFCERYPNTRYIDVVNEPPPHTTPSYVNALGGGTNGNWQWITTAFEMAHEHCPNAILILNDFNNIEWDNDSNHFIGITQTIMQAGAPIDAVGAQAHDLDQGSVSFQKVQGLLQKLHDETGLPVYITEFDISTTNDQSQQQTYQQYFPLFDELDYVRGVTIWGWIRGRTWSAAPESGLVSQQGAPRPAMTWLMEWLGRPSP